MVEVAVSLIFLMTAANGGESLRSPDSRIQADTKHAPAEMTLAANSTATIAKIERAFATDSPWPKKFAVSGAYDEEQIDNDFARLWHEGDREEIIRRNRNSLHALNVEAFVRLLPFYLRFGLANPKSEIMDFVVYFFDRNSERTQSIRERLHLLSQQQIEVLKRALLDFRDASSEKDDFMAKQIETAIATIDQLTR